MQKFSLDDLYHMVSHIYSEQNVHRPVQATFAHFVEVCGMLTMHSRKKHREEVDFSNALCKALGWLFPLLAKCRVKSVEDIVFRKFPYACPYCRLEVHKDEVCKVVKGTKSTVDHAALELLQLKNAARKPSTLEEWRTMFSTIYPRSLNEDRSRSTLGLMEELGELAEAIRVFEHHPRYFAGEVADIFSYIMGMATEYSLDEQLNRRDAFDFDREFIKRYPGFCLACGNQVCICPAIPDATIGRMSKELEIKDLDLLFYRTSELSAPRGATIAEELRRTLGSEPELLAALPLDRGEINHSLVLICVSLANRIEATDPATAEKLRLAAEDIGRSATAPGSRHHNPVPRGAIALITQAIAAVPEGAATVGGSGAIRADAVDILSPARILVAGSTPIDGTRISVDSEAREIEEAIRRSIARERFVVESAQAVTATDLRRRLLDRQFKILHFSGHGDENGIYLSDDRNDSAHVTTEALRLLIEQNPSIECVVLNCCETARALQTALAPITVGMVDPVDDDAAVLFAKGFYDAVGAGRSYDDAIEQGRVSARLGGRDVPLKLLKK